MIGAVARKELLALVRDGRLWTFGLTLALLFVAVSFSAARQREGAEQERRQVEQAVRAQWDEQGDKNPHRAAHFGLYAFKPRTALSGIEPGVDAQAGQALWLEPHKRNMAGLAPEADVVSSLGLGAFTPAFVLLALVPLLIVVLGHGTLTQEREIGTLRMLHASGMRGLPLAMGKCLGLYAGVAVVLAPALALGAWVMADGRGLAATAVLGIALWLYYTTWTAGTVLTSALCPTSRAALLVLSAVWLATAFLVPRLSASAVERIAPLPSGEQFWSGIEHDIARGLAGDGTAAERLEAFDAELLAANRVSRLEDLPFGANARRRLFRDAYATRVHALHFAALGETQRAQQGLLRWSAVLSPYVPMRAVASALAGTDLAHRQHFEDAAERYRQRFTTLMDEWDLASTRGVTSFEDRYAGNAQWQAIPPWRYAAPGLAFALSETAFDWAALAAWCAATFGALAWAARRLDP